MNKNHETQRHEIRNNNCDSQTIYCMNESAEEPLVANREYKDTVFRMLFSEKSELLSLYNALNGTSYEDPEELEITTLKNAIYMTVMQININPGYNDELLKSCPSLYGYMQFVEKIRKNQKTMPLTDAVTQAVNDCIKENILADFLKKNKAEVVSMSLFEYDEKKHEQTMIEIGREEGDIRRLSLQIIKKIPKNKSLAQIADELEEDPETIQPLYNVVLQHAPDFDMDEIMKDVSTMQK